MLLEHRPARAVWSQGPGARLRAAHRWTLGLVTAALVLASGASPTAAQPADSDWPCIQRLVPELAFSQMWAGPRPDGAKDAASANGEIAELAHRLASRATPDDEAQAAIDRFAASLPAEQRNPQLGRLFDEVLQLINQERSEIIAGIKGYTRKQQHLAQKIAQDSRQLANLQPGTTPDAKTQALLNERQWDLRVFEDRRRILTQVCEQPVLLEQRAFSLSRAMQAELEPK
jgi:hypothetical protein